MRALLSAQNFTGVVGFQPAKLIHRTHVEFTRRATAENHAGLLINAVAGAEAMDTSYFSRIRSYETILVHYEPQTVQLNLMQLARRLCGPREALWHAIINKNYGCSHFIVEHDYAGQGDLADGEPVYGRYSAQELLAQHADAIGIKLIRFRDLVPEEDRLELFVTGSRLPLKTDSDRHKKREFSEQFSYPSVIAELHKATPNRERQGFTVFFTGLSGAGKSTIANILQARLLECSGREVTLLDGDLVRKHLSVDLGFSREHRDINVRRIGYVASLITKNHGVAICAPIAPYAQTRAEVRTMVEACGGFIEVYVATSLEVCEARDCKGLYAKARIGLVKEFTGIDSPYEVPSCPEVVIDTSGVSASSAADQILCYLVKIGFIKQRLSSREEEISGIVEHRIPKVLCQKNRQETATEARSENTER
jgi:sulfate adenylyltransferase